MKFFRCSILILFIVFGLSGHSQIRHGIWQGHSVIRSNSVMLPYVFNQLGHFVNGYYVGRHSNGEINDSESLMDYYNNNSGFTPYTQWFAPIRELDMHLPNWRLYHDNEEISLVGPDWWKCLLFGDFKHNYNFSLGYTLQYRSLDYPIGVYIGINYEWRGLYVANGELTGKHRLQQLIPTFGMRFHVLGYDFEREHNWNVLFGISTSYCKVLKYNDPNGFGRSAVNDGWRMSASIGGRYGRNEFAVKYEWDCYDFFNIEGVSTDLQSLMFVFYYIL